MTLSVLFWILMILWAVLGAAPYFKGGERSWPAIGGAFLVWCAVAVLGWAVFGAMVKG